MSVPEEQRPACNPFLLLGGRPWATPRSGVYAILDQAEIGEDGLHRLIYSAVDADWFDGAARRREIEEQITQRNFAAIFDAMPIFLLEIWLSSRAVEALHVSTSKEFTRADTRAPGGPLPPKLFETLEELERRWKKFRFGGRGVEAALFPNLFAAVPTAVTVASTADPDAATRGLLNRVDPLAQEPDASTQSIESELQGLSGAGSVRQVAVYDVGQGGANGLLDSSGAVITYFDFGGGTAAHTGTFPPTLASFCFCRAPDAPIVLSHWDHDHWSSEGRDTRSHAKTWIVPRQAGLGLHHGALIVTIRKSGKLLVWPGSVTSLTVGQMTILKCTGGAKNSSGLAVEIASPSSLTGLPVLLPADAGYGDLPAVASGHFDAIACPHHGGRSHSPTILGRPAGSYQRLAYSYGHKNTYGHPLPPTWAAHHAASWLDPRAGHPHPGEVRNTEDRNATGLGHIGLTWGAAAIAPACTGTCQLGIQQT